MQRSAIRLSFLPMATDSCLAAPHAEEYATDAYRHHEARETRREDLLRRGNAQQQDRGGPRDHPATLAHPVVQARSVFASRIRVDSLGQYLGCTLLVWGCGRIRHAEQSDAKSVGEVVDDSDDVADGGGDRHPRDDLPKGPRPFHRIRCPRPPCHRFFLKGHDCSSLRRRWKTVVWCESRSAARLRFWRKEVASRSHRRDERKGRHP